MSGIALASGECRHNGWQSPTASAVPLTGESINPWVTSHFREESLRIFLSAGSHPAILERAEHDSELFSSSTAPVCGVLIAATVIEAIDKNTDFA